MASLGHNGLTNWGLMILICGSELGHQPLSVPMLVNSQLHPKEHTSLKFILTCKVFPGWHHQMETFATLLALYEGNPAVTARTNGCANNPDACDLRLHHAHYDVTVMFWENVCQYGICKPMAILLWHPCVTVTTTWACSLFNFYTLQIEGKCK